MPFTKEDKIWLAKLNADLMFDDRRAEFMELQGSNYMTIDELAELERNVHHMMLDAGWINRERFEREENIWQRIEVKLGDRFGGLA